MKFIDIRVEFTRPALDPTRYESVRITNVTSVEIKDGTLTVYVDGYIHSSYRTWIMWERV